MTAGRLLKFPRPRDLAVDVRKLSEAVLATPIDSRREHAKELGLEDPEVLLGLCGLLRDRLESDPSSVRRDAEFLYTFVVEPRRSIGLFDEREYFLGELSLLAGSSARSLALRDEAKLWFDRADASFRLTVNAVGDWSRVAYQRLALLLEERRLVELMELAPALVRSFESLEMTEDALKTKMLQGLASMELGRLDEAAIEFEEIRARAEKVGIQRLLAAASVNLVHAYSMAGRTAEALASGRQAEAVLISIGSKLGSAKLQLGLGFLLRSSGEIDASMEAYRAAQTAFADLAMYADVAAANLVLADLLIDLGRGAEARREIAAALPIVGEYKLVPEGMAALTLLKESLKQGTVDRRALRDLHGFFEDSVS